MKTNGIKSRRSPKALALQSLIESINAQIDRHQIAIEELEALKQQLQGEEIALSDTASKRDALKVAG